VIAGRLRTRIAFGFGAAGREGLRPHRENAVRGRRGPSTLSPPSQNRRHNPECRTFRRPPAPPGGGDRVSDDVQRKEGGSRAWANHSMEKLQWGKARSRARRGRRGGAPAEADATAAGGPAAGGQPAGAGGPTVPASPLPVSQAPASPSRVTAAPAPAPARAAAPNVMPTTGALAASHGATRFATMGVIGGIGVVMGQALARLGRKRRAGGGDAAERAPSEHGR